MQAYLSDAGGVGVDGTPLWLGPNTYKYILLLKIGVNNKLYIYKYSYLLLLPLLPPLPDALKSLQSKTSNPFQPLPTPSS